MNQANNKSKVVMYMSYDEWEDIKEGMNSRRKERIAKERRRKAMYFRRQHLAGAIVSIVGITCLGIGCKIDSLVMQIFGALVGIMGLNLIVTKNMILVDGYFLERQDKMNEY